MVQPPGYHQFFFCERKKECPPTNYGNVVKVYLTRWAKATFQLASDHRKRSKIFFHYQGNLIILVPLSGRSSGIIWLQLLRH